MTFERRGPGFFLGVAGLACFVVAGALGPLLVGDAGLALDLEHDLAPPSVAGRLGRAERGIDVLTALVFGARTSLITASVTSVIAIAIGATVGVTVGVLSTRGRRASMLAALLSRGLDVVLAFPGLLLALLLLALLPPSASAVITALVASSWAGTARVLTGLAREIALRDHVVAAQALGASVPRVVLVHVAPLLRGQILVQATQTFGGAVVAEASLSFLGLGPAPGTPPLYTSWGAQLDEATALVFAAPHLLWPPALCVLSVAVSAQLVADGVIRSR